MFQARADVLGEVLFLKYVGLPDIPPFQTEFSIQRFLGVLGVCWLLSR